MTIVQVVSIVKKTLYLTLLKSLSVYVKSKIKIGYIRASNKELISNFNKSRTETARLYHIQDLESMDGNYPTVNKIKFREIN